MSLAPRIARQVTRQIKRQREGMSARHLEDIRGLLCCVCGKPPPSDPHHLKAGMVALGQRGTGYRAADKFVIPLCRDCHDYYGEGDDEVRLASVGIDGRALADSLWRERGNFEAMLRIVLRTIETARLKVAALKSEKVNR